MIQIQTDHPGRPTVDSFSPLSSAGQGRLSRRVSISFRRYRPGDRPGIEALNARLEQAGVSDRVYPEADDPQRHTGPITQELYVAAAADGAAIHGGVWLHEQEFLIGGQRVTAGWLKYPVAESLIDRAYSGVPAGLILTVLRRQPLLMALGMGGRNSPLAQLLQGIGWTVLDVPFGVAPLNAMHVLNELRALRTHGRLGLMARFLVATRTAPLAFAPVNLLRKLRMRRQLAGITVTEEASFGEWSDRIWEQQQVHYPFIGRRDAALLNRMYEQHSKGIKRFRITRNGSDVAWLCTRTMGPAQQTPHPQFGRLKVGMIVDSVADPADSKTVFAVGLRELASAGADLVVSNQMHPAWRNAMQAMLLPPAPSNFVFAYSKQMKALIQQHGAEEKIYITRGDCDGPPWW